MIFLIVSVRLWFDVENRKDTIGNDAEIIKQWLWFDVENRKDTIKSS